MMNCGTMTQGSVSLPVMMLMRKWVLKIHRTEIIVPGMVSRKLLMTMASVLSALGLYLSVDHNAKAGKVPKTRKQISSV